MSGENVINLTDQNFDTEITNAEGVALVDFWAPWCGPCRMVGPIVEEIASEYTGKIKVGKVNTDDAPETATKFGIRSIPTLIVFKDGKAVDQIVGAVPKDTITEKLDGAL